MTKHREPKRTRGSSFSDRIVAVLQRLPYGRVATYGQVAAMAGSPRAARQVARVLHSKSKLLCLPWHRVVNARGGISMPTMAGFELQAAMLRDEGVAVDKSGRVDLERYLWIAQ